MTAKMISLLRVALIKNMIEEYSLSSFPVTFSFSQLHRNVEKISLKLPIFVLTVVRAGVWQQQGTKMFHFSCGVSDPVPR